VFDDTVSGTTPRYTPARLNEDLGRADVARFLVAVSGVSGTAPTLTVDAEGSLDARTWFLIDGAALLSTPLTDNATYLAITALVVTGSMMRLKFTLGGTTPQCHLKVFAAGTLF
jgi:hypothetical protein